MKGEMVTLVIRVLALTLYTRTMSRLERNCNAISVRLYIVYENNVKKTKIGYILMHKLAIWHTRGKIREIARMKEDSYVTEMRGGIIPCCIGRKFV